MLRDVLGYSRCNLEMEALTGMFSAITATVRRIIAAGKPPSPKAPSTSTRKKTPSPKAAPVAAAKSVPIPRQTRKASSKRRARSTSRPGSGSNSNVEPGSPPTAEVVLEVPPGQSKYYTKHRQDGLVYYRLKK